MTDKQIKRLFYVIRWPFLAAIQLVLTPFILLNSIMALDANTLRWWIGMTREMLFNWNTKDDGFGEW